MTDTAPSKPISVRCPGCKTLIFNETLNLQVHKLYCPLDLQKRMQKIEDRLEGIEGTVDELEQAPIPEPALTVGDWPDDDEDDDVPATPGTYFTTGSTTTL